MVILDPKSTALVLIDLQNGILSMNLAPQSGQIVMERGHELAATFRKNGGLVVLVRVAFAPDYADAPGGITDANQPRPQGGLPPEWSELSHGLLHEGDLVITKHQWGAFTGTDLDLQLRRRGIKTLVLGGIATNFGVESTVRHAWELNYNVVVCEDACTSVSTELHETAIRHIFPRLSRVVASNQITLAAG